MRVLGRSVLFVAFAAPAVLAQAPQPKMGAPLSGLSVAELARFTQGKSDFQHTFQPAEGLGPTFNQASCASCHNNPVGGSGSIKVTRFGFYDPKGIGWDPLASLGGSLLQLNTINIAIQEVVPPEANVTANRVTPSALGDGLIEAIADADILVRETTPPSVNVSGRAHMVVPLETPGGAARVGRFGWKAQVPTVLTFSGDASMNELGFTNALVPNENAPNGNTALLALYDTVPDPEDQPNGQGQRFIDRITDFQRFLAAPPQTPRSGMAGEALFMSVGCADCHTPSYTTRNDPALESAIRNKAIRPYSDFLLHDMGTAADFIGDGAADIQELRTPPLWGVRVRDPMWHDGRVIGGTFEQRIVGVVAQHAGIASESRPSALAFQALSLTDQRKIVAFLDSLGRAEFDINGDNVRDQVDLAAFRAAMNGGPYTPDSPEAVFDFDQDGDVDQADLANFALVYEVDCDGNGTTDLQDVLSGVHGDTNGNYVPDICEYCQPDLGFAGAGTLRTSICGDVMTNWGDVATWDLWGAPANSGVLVALSPTASPFQYSATEFLVPTMPFTALVSFLVTDNNGRIRLGLLGGGGPNVTWIIQAAAFNGTEIDLSNAIQFTLGQF